MARTRKYGGYKAPTSKVFRKKSRTANKRGEVKMIAVKWPKKKFTQVKKWRF